MQLETVLAKWMESRYQMVDCVRLVEQQQG